MRLFLLLLGLGALILIPFLLFGDSFMESFSGSGAREWVVSLGAWGWLAGVGLLMSDVILPVPATSVVSALGYVYGAVVGGMLGAAGSFLSGALAYECCRRQGGRAADWLLGIRDRERAARIFAGGTGGWLVALSRWMPLLPEMTACMAGLTGMGRVRFFTALACGCMPMGITFAVVGAAGTESPQLALWLSALLPAVLYGVAVFWTRRKMKGGKL